MPISRIGGERMGGRGSKRVMASLVGSSSPTVQRRAMNAKRAIDKLDKEYELLEQAYKRRKKSKEIIPF